MIKKFRLATLAICMLSLFSTYQANAQYYYKDIWNTRQLIKDFSILKAEKLRYIRIKSFEDDGEPSEGFRCEKKINSDFTKSEMISRSYITGESLLVSEYDNGAKIIRITDNTPTTTSITDYTYNAEGQLSMVKIDTKEDDGRLAISETREYTYDGKGLPATLERKKNNIPVSSIIFKKDSSGNITEETVITTSATDKKYYYYYDDKNRLTDVVHFNDRAEKLLPDYMYEYDDSDQAVQMISASETGDNYFIWRYIYNDNKLRETEMCFSKEKRLLGKIVYEYK